MTFFFDKLIFKRFFIRKNQKSRNEWYLFIMFVLIITTLSSLIFFQSLSLFDLSIQKQKYLNEPGNRFYNLFVGDLNDVNKEQAMEPNAFKDFIKSLSSKSLKTLSMVFSLNPKTL